MKGTCGIYEERPERCREFPLATDWRPVPCAYTFDADGTRQGDCDPEVCGVENCCNFPRDGGKPEAHYRRSGLPCEHLKGLEGTQPHPSHGMMTAHALWVNDVVLERHAHPLDPEAPYWAIGRVRDYKVRDTVYVSDQWLRERIEPVTGTVKALAASPRGPLYIHLTKEQTEALWKLRPRPVMEV